MIVKLVNDRGVLNFYDGEQHATLSVGGLTLSNAVPVFTTDHRHRFQANKGEPCASLGRVACTVATDCMNVRSFGPPNHCCFFIMLMKMKGQASILTRTKT